MMVLMMLKIKVMVVIEGIKMMIIIMMVVVVVVEELLATASHNEPLGRGRRFQPSLRWKPKKMSVKMVWLNLN